MNRAPDFGKSYFQGELVKLVVPDLDRDGVLLSDWTRDSEYFRLAMAEPAHYRYPDSQKKWLEEANQQGYLMMIVTQADQKTIGEVELCDINPASGNAWLSIGIGERDFWGKKYGREAVKLIMDYAFMILNLQRLSLNVFEYNKRALKVYQKLGFVIEGCEKKWLNRDGKRWDMIYMGILKQDWLLMNPLETINQ